MYFTVGLFIEFWVLPQARNEDSILLCDLDTSRGNFNVSNLLFAPVHKRENVFFSTWLKVYRRSVGL